MLSGNLTMSPQRAVMMSQ